MPVRSKRLFGPLAVGTGGTTVYTCPAGETALVKHLTFVNGSNLATTLQVGVGGLLVGNLVAQFSVPAQGSVALVSWFLVLQPGETLRMGTTLGNVTVAGFGAELEGVAD